MEWTGVGEDDEERKGENGHAMEQDGEETVAFRLIN